MPFEFSERPALYNLSPLERFNLVKEKQSLRREKYIRLKRAQYSSHRDHNKDIINRIYDNVKTYENKLINNKRLLLTNSNDDTSKKDEDSKNNKRLKTSIPESDNASFAFSANFNYDDIIDEENRKASDNIASDILKNKNVANTLSSAISVPQSLAIGKLDSSMKVLPSNGFTFAKRDLSSLVQHKQDQQPKPSKKILLSNSNTVEISETSSPGAEISTKKQTFSLGIASPSTIKNDVNKSAFSLGGSSSNTTTTKSDDKKPAFSFGTPSLSTTSKTDDKSAAFSFNAISSIAKFDAEKPKFSFGSSTANNNSNADDYNPKSISSSFGEVQNHTSDGSKNKRALDNDDNKNSEEKKVPQFRLTNNSSSTLTSKDNENTSSEKAQFTFALKDGKAMSKSSLAVGAGKVSTIGRVGDEKETKELPKPAFSFKSVGNPVTNTSTAISNHKPAPMSFSFGAAKPEKKSDEKDEKSKTPSFTFGATNKTAFGITSSKTVKNSEENVIGESSKPTISFTVSATDKTGASSFLTKNSSEPKEPAKTASAFIFGSTNINDKLGQSSSATNGFTFGSKPASSAPPTVDPKKNTGSSSPGFSFNSKTTSSNETASLFGSKFGNVNAKTVSSEKPSFSFLNKPPPDVSKTTDSKTLGFTFGSANSATSGTANASAPKFTFGQASIPEVAAGAVTATKPTLSFGVSSINTSTQATQLNTNKGNSMFSFSPDKENTNKSKTFSSLNDGASAGGIFGDGGSSKKASERSGSGFTFGTASSNIKETPQGMSFNFGASDTTTNSGNGFKFGTSSNVATGGSLFGNKSDSKATPTFGNTSGATPSFNLDASTVNTNNNNGSSTSGFTFGASNVNNTSNKAASGFSFGANSNSNNNGFTFSASSSRSTTPAVNFAASASNNANNNMFNTNNNNIYGNGSSPAPTGPFGVQGNNNVFGKSISPAPMSTGFGSQNNNVNNANGAGFGANNGSNNSSFNFANNSNNSNNSSGFNFAGNNNNNNSGSGFNFGGSSSNNGATFSFTGTGGGNSASVDPSTIFNGGQQASTEELSNRKFLIPKRRTRR